MKQETATQPAKTANLQMVTLKAICVELKIDPRLAREKLRIAVRETKNFLNSRKLINRGEHGSG